MRTALIAIILIIVVIASGCVEQTVEQDSAPSAQIKTEEPVAIGPCISLCYASISAGKSLADGPCLSFNNSAWVIEDWVCDIAHAPRVDVDNQLENQCVAFREGRAHHFVELDSNCNFIRAV